MFYILLFVLQSDRSCNVFAAGTGCAARSRGWARDSLAWPDPSRSRKGEEEKGGGEKEEGSGDSEQDVVTSANMAAEPIRLQ